MRPRSTAAPCSAALRRFDSAFTIHVALLNPSGGSGPPMWHEDLNPDDQIATSRGPGGSAAGEGRPAGVRLGPQPQGLHQPPVVRRPGPEDVLQDRLPGRRPTPDRPGRPPQGPRADQGAPLLDPVLRGRTAAKKGEVVVLLLRATTSAQDRGLIGDEPTAAVDGTGLESRHTSRYFFRRAGRKHTSRLWTKLSVAADTPRGGRHYKPGCLAPRGVQAWAGWTSLLPPPRGRLLRRG